MKVTSAARVPIANFKCLVGSQIGVSDWFRLDQPRITEFAALTEDEQFIHIDPAAAAERTSFGGTIAHGFLSLSLLSAMAADAMTMIEGAEVVLNYGLNSVRFLKPVRAGERIRGTFVLKDFQQRQPGQWQSTVAVTVEIEGMERPALVAEWLVLSLLPQSENVARS